MKRCANFFVAHDLIRKPVPTFRDHALLRRRLLQRPLEREDAGDGGSAAHGRIELHRTTMQLNEGSHDRKAKPRATMLRAERMALETVEHALADLGRDARSAVGHTEDDGAVAPLDTHAHHL